MIKNVTGISILTDYTVKIRLQPEATRVDMPVYIKPSLRH